MAETGTLRVRTYVSTAQFPVSGATVIVSAPNKDGRHKLLFIALTDQNGVVGPITLDAPARELGLTPGQKETAFSSYTIVVEHPDYQLAVFEQLQVFSGIETIQDVPLIPISANGKDRQDMTVVTPQLL